MDSNLKIALRDSKEATRPYLIVNSLLAKHLPSKPTNSLEYFKELGDKINKVCINEKVLVIGFAETATAVGATVASLIKDAVYVHTTRETLDLKQSNLIVDFLEEHSHAKNQSLYLKEEYKDLSRFDRIIFVEDEITTGKTILNFLKNISYQGKISISALVFNGFSEEVFADYDATFFCLQKIGYLHNIFMNGLPDTRLGVDVSEYKSQCDKIAEQTVNAINMADLKDKNILVLGTEEFMYPALLIGSYMEKIAKSVVSHSTTRSPIVPKDDSDYPIYSRCKFKSVYNAQRDTYLYNLQSYDTVIVVTNSKTEDCGDFIKTIQNSGNQKNYIVRIENV